MSLRKQAASGVRWTGVSAAITTGLQLFKLVVLARLLDPGDFGLMVMVWVVIGFAQAFEDMGMSKAIIHLQSSTREQLSSLYWLNIMAGIVVFVLVVASSPLVVGFYREPRLMALIPWAALVFLVTPIGQQFQVLLQKELRFAQLAKMEMASTAIGAVVAIASAIAGLGVFSLIWGHLAETSAKAISFAGFGWANWRPKLHFRWSDLRNCVAFGSYQMAERSLNYFSANVDFIVIGRFLGPETLAIYMLAYQLVTIPLGKMNPIVTRVAFPIFAKKQTDNATLRHGYLAMIKLLAFVVVPLLTGLAVTAPLVVPIAFGPRWKAAIPLIQILALLGILKALVNPSGSILLAKGRSDIGFRWEVVATVVNTPVFWSVVTYGAYAVAWSYVGWCVIDFIVGWLILHHIIRLDYREYLAVLLTPVVSSSLMGIAVYIGYLLLAGLGVNEPVLLICLVGLGVGIYGSASIVEREYLRDLWALLFKRERMV